MRRPLVTNGGRGSFGTAFLFTVMCARPSAASASLPVMFLSIRSTQEQMIVGAAGDDLVAALHQRRRPWRARSRAPASGTRLNSGCSASSNATALAAITCISGPPCVPGNTSELSFLSISSFGAREDQAAARTAQRLVRRRRDDVGVRHGIRIDAGSDEAGDVRHVDEEVRADAVGDRAEALPVDDARIRREAGDDHPRPMLLRELLDLRVVDLAGVPDRARTARP